MSAFRAALSLLDGAPGAASASRAPAPTPGVLVLPADLAAAARRRRVVLDLVSDFSRSLHVLFLHGLDCFYTCRVTNHLAEADRLGSSYFEANKTDIWHQSRNFLLPNLITVTG